MKAPRKVPSRRRARHVACILRRSYVHGGLHHFTNLDVLIHNAGVVHRARVLTEDGLEATLVVDAIGPFLLTVLLLDRLEAARGRVIQLAGIYHRRGEIALDDLAFDHRPYDWKSANAGAQLARVVLTAELARRSKRVFAASVHPGAVWTSLPQTFAGTFVALVRWLLRPAFVRPALGAIPVVRLAAEPLPAEPDPEHEHPLSNSGRFFDRYELTADVPDALLCDLLWQKCEELTGVHGPAGVSMSLAAQGR